MNEEQIVVDGETFIVRHAGDDVWSYEWVSGPNPNYGFTSSRLRCIHHTDPGDGTIVPDSSVPPDHDDAIRNFLAMIDPETGYIGD
ncbi:hypothetical protein [Gordonia sp. (in: high G+C Gram-positive bacteria)]|uniref:hypothetical protein n=1 Tax=Gordonia sp. (in: high G+C Gram-positive bacteria) TaxID=84139 RepID=UPI003F9448D5